MTSTMTTARPTDTITRVIRAASYGRACEAAKAQGLAPGSWTYLRDEPPPEPHPTWIARPTVPVQHYPSHISRKADAVPTEFGTLLFRLRAAVPGQLSQSKLAEKAGFDHSYVSRLESGARMPTREAVDRLAEHLGDGTHDQLLTAAGFLPVDVSSLLSSEPVVGDVLDLLQDEGVPTEYRENLRQVLELLTAQVRFAVNGGTG